MSKFVAINVSKMINENNQIILCFSVSKDNRCSAEAAYRELKALPENSKYQLSITQYKSKRSLEQNRMLWALIEKITLEQSGYARKEDVEDCYCNLIEEANIKDTYEYLPALESSKASLESNYRVVKNFGKRIIVDPRTNKQTECVLYKCFKGSSSFNTKQMSELIELALDTLAELGVADSEILAIREEYKC